MDGTGSRKQTSAVRSLTSPSWASKVLVFLLIVASILVIVTMALGLVTERESLVKADKYQAVFLTNGQVYFGKLSSGSAGYFVLKEAYYLQQQNNQQTQQPQANQTQQANLSLVKRGNELHGPEAEMFIDRDQVLFWENLKDDGRVVQAIKGNRTVQ